MEKTNFGFGTDPIVIRHYVAGFKGGKVLDVSDFAPEYIRAGHVVIRKDEVYKPMPVNGEAYATLPQGWEYCGIVVASVLRTEPFVAIMHTGEVNDKVMPYLTDAVKTALKAAVPTLVFNHD